MSQHGSQYLPDSGHRLRPVGMVPSPADVFSAASPQRILDSVYRRVSGAVFYISAMGADDLSSSAGGISTTTGNEFDMSDPKNDHPSQDGEISDDSSKSQESTAQDTAGGTEGTGDTASTKIRSQSEGSNQDKGNRSDSWSSRENATWMIGYYNSKAVQTTYDLEAIIEDEKNKIIKEANAKIRKLKLKCEEKDKLFRQQTSDLQRKEQDIIILNNDIIKLEQEWKAYLQKVQDRNVAEMENLRIELSQKGAELERVLGERLDSVDDYQPLIDTDLKEPFLKLRTKVKLFANKHCKSGKDLATKDLKAKMNQLTMTTNITKSMWERERLAIIQSVIWRRLTADIFADPIAPFLEKLPALSRLRRELFSRDDEANRLFGNNKEYQMWQSITTSLFLPRPSQNRRDEVSRIASVDKWTEPFRALLVETLGKDIEPVATPSDSLNRGLDDLAKLACCVAAVFVTQRCGLEVFYPFDLQCEGGGGASERLFNAAFQEPSRDVGRFVEFVVAPGLIKHGNGMGQHMDSLEVLVKAEVMLGSE